MGIEYQAVLIVGLHRDDIENGEIIDDLDEAAPYFDGAEHAICGVFVERSGDYCATEITLDQAKVDAAKAKFLRLTGQEGKLWLTPRGW